MNIEPLEARIAPAILLNFIDVDGDAITVAISKGNPIGFVFGTLTNPNNPFGGTQLTLLDLQGDQSFSGANISITAKPQDRNGDGVKDGNGLVNFGFINATGVDLGTAFVEGDLGAIDAGNPANSSSACKGLTVSSLGRFGLSTQNPFSTPDLVSNFDGKLDKLTVKSDVFEAFISVTDSAVGGTNGKIGSVFIGGSLLGGLATGSGSIYTTHGLGPVTIKGDIVGGLGLTSGAVTSDQAIASVTVGGSLRGGPGLTSGVIFSSLGSVGPVKIGGDIVGGSVINTGRIFAKTTLTSLTVGGSIFGGAENSGRVHSDGSIGPVKVGHAVIGGSGDGSGAIDAGSSLGAVTLGESLFGGNGENSGKIFSGAAMGAVTIGGSLNGGGDFSAGVIRSGAAMGLVKIGGDITAGSSVETGRIYSTGTLAGVTVGGSVVGLSFGSGAGSQSGEIRSDGAMGPVKIGGTVTGGSALQSGRIFSQGSITSVRIGGSLVGGFGSPDTGEIVSESALGPVKIGGDIVGGATFSLGGSGYIEGQRIASLFVGGSIRAGFTDMSGSVRAIDDIGPIVIKGNLAGRPDPDGDPMNGGATHAIISARGQAGLSATAKTDVAIKSITIGGRVELVQILAGYDTALQPKNADAQIGAVSVGGDWIASNLIVGVISADATFGNSDDAKISGAGVKDNADNNGKGANSKIAAVVIKGRALGTADSTDLAIFGIEAQQIVSLKVTGTTIQLTPGAGNDLNASRRPLGATFDAGGDFDFHAFEVLLT